MNVPSPFEKRTSTNWLVHDDDVGVAVAVPVERRHADDRVGQRVAGRGAVRAVRLRKEDGHARSAPRDHQIVQAVSVEVSRCNACLLRAHAHRVAPGGDEVSRGRPEKDTHVVARIVVRHAAVRRRDVEVAVSVVVAGDDRHGCLTGDVADRRREGAVAEAAQDAHSEPGERRHAAVRRDQVELPVAVEVPGDDPERRDVHRVVGGAPEASVAVAEQYRDAVLGGRRRRGAVGQGEIDVAVVVEIGRRDGGRRREPEQVLVRAALEGPVADAQVDVNAADPVRDGNVGLPVMVEIRHDEALGVVRSVAKLAGAEAPRSIAEEDLERVVGVVDDGEVGLAVAVEVSHRDAGRAEARGHRRGALEGAVAVAEQDARVVAAAVGHHQIGPSVAVEVPDGHTEGRRADGIGRGRLEGAVALSEEHDRRRAAGDDEVHLAVPIEVPGRDGGGGLRRGGDLGHGAQVDGPRAERRGAMGRAHDARPRAAARRAVAALERRVLTAAARCPAAAPVPGASASPRTRASARRSGATVPPLALPDGPSPCWVPGPSATRRALSHAQARLMRVTTRDVRRREVIDTPV